MERCTDKNDDVTSAILAFDTLYTTNHMKILKLLLPYLESKQQQNLAVFIKWQELLFTLNFSRQYSASLYDSDFTKKKTLDFTSLLPLLSSYCSEKEKALLSQFSQMQNMMNMMEEVQQYLPMLQQFMSAMSTQQDTSGSDSPENPMMDMLKNMMSEEQQAMFSMFMDKDM